ncbi:hypothetical protein M231_06517 [Tremella mesenterica]|uniref:Uncharacterized protein n=1 Tax=Tremella mesenterica TaxID=5217 RepID=A0A4Q1BDF6_TREME|nr:hypothetical protein M231_06517 [Tremella mesenterica]
MSFTKREIVLATTQHILEIVIVVFAIAVIIFLARLCVQRSLARQYAPRAEEMLQAVKNHQIQDASFSDSAGAARAVIEEERPKLGWLKRTLLWKSENALVRKVSKNMKSGGV